MKQILGNTAVFVLLYIVFMIPTYILPYFGSNSSIAITAWASGVEVPQFLMHIGALLALMVVTWFRGSLVYKKWLLIFPILATVFDFIPGLSSIPLVPTVMHLLAIILGVIGTTVPDTATQASTSKTPIQPETPKDKIVKSDTRNQEITEKTANEIVSGKEDITKKLENKYDSDYIHKVDAKQGRTNKSIVFAGLTLIFFIFVGVYVYTYYDDNNSPPKQFTDVGGCPGEGCYYGGTWYAKELINTFDQMDGDNVTFTLVRGEKFTPLTGVVITTPKKINLQKDMDLGVDAARKGEDVYVVAYKGEGIANVWYKGKVYSDVDLTCCLRTWSGMQEIWWIKVKNDNGQEGWTKEREKIWGTCGEPCGESGKFRG